MAQKYNLFRVDGLYCIHEDRSLKVLKLTKNRKDALKYLNSLNSGSGFDGETPDFFVLKKDADLVFGIK